MIRQIVLALMVYSLQITSMQSQPFSKQYKSTEETGINRFKVAANGNICFVGSLPTIYSTAAIAYHIFTKDRTVAAMVDADGNLVWKKNGEVLENNTTSFNLYDVEYFDDLSMITVGAFTNWDTINNIYYSQPAMFKFNANGQQEWGKYSPIENSDDVLFKKSFKTKLNDVFVMVREITYAATINDVINHSIIKVDFNGNILFKKGIKSASLYINAIKSEDEDLIIDIAPWGYSGGFRNMAIFKIDGMGNIKWAKVNKTPSPSLSPTFPYYYNQIATALDKGFVSVGAQFNNNFNCICIAKYDSIGNNQWCRLDSLLNFTNISKIVTFPDSGYMVSGHKYFFEENQHKGILLKLDKNGLIEWAKMRNDFSAINDMALLPNGNLLIGGFTTDQNGKKYASLEKINTTSFTNCWHDIPFGDTSSFTINMADTTIELVDQTLTMQNATFKNLYPLQAYDNCGYYSNNTTSPQIFPNPANDYFFISIPQLQNSTATLIIYNAIGQLVHKTENINTQLTQINTKDFATGVYLYSLTFNDKTFNGKILLGK